MSSEDIDKKIDELAKSGDLSKEQEKKSVFGFLKKPKDPEEVQTENKDQTVSDNKIDQLENRMEGISQFVLRSAVKQSLPGNYPEKILNGLKKDIGDNDIMILLPQQPVLCKLSEIQSILEYFDEKGISWDDVIKVCKQSKQKDYKKE